jgi:hypothetical protein
MRRSIIALLLLTACFSSPPPMAQLAPKQLTSPLAPVEVVRRATAKLIALGFDIALSDATGGVVQSKLARVGPGDAVCNLIKGNYYDSIKVVALTVSITALKTDASSTVTITSRVVTEYPGAAVARRPSSEDCASTGALEQQVASAIAAP